VAPAGHPVAPPTLSGRPRLGEFTRYRDAIILPTVAHYDRTGTGRFVPMSWADRL